MTLEVFPLTATKLGISAIRATSGGLAQLRETRELLYSTTPMPTPSQMASKCRYTPFRRGGGSAHQHIDSLLFQDIEASQKFLSIQ